MNIFRFLLQIKKLRNLAIKQIESGEMLGYLMRRRTFYKNFAKILKYLNRMINGICNPKLIGSGFWKG